MSGDLRTGRLSARRRTGYQGEQNGQSVLAVAAGHRLLRNQNRIVRVTFIRAMVKSATIIVTDANALTRIIHDRMPVILDRRDVDAASRSRSSVGEVRSNRADAAH